MQVTYGAGIPLRSMRDRVAHVEQVLNSLPQVDCPVRHYFAPGVYMREITIKQGTAVTGAIHKTDNLVVVSMGRLRVVTDGGFVDVEAGDTFTCKAGTKNAVVALDDSRWANIFPNPDNETDTDKLVEVFTESKASELLGGADNKQLALNRIAHDHADYALFIDEFGFSQRKIDSMLEYTADFSPIELDGMQLFASPIHGRGIRATRSLQAGINIGMARIGIKRTQLGRFLNHSKTPNIQFNTLANGSLVAFTIRDIAAGEELTNCYRQAMRVNGTGIKPLKEIL
jgi:quercetin dioxygenase-like cupin family protein